VPTKHAEKVKFDKETEDRDHQKREYEKSNGAVERKSR
jgi:hypothetical protein